MRGWIWISYDNVGIFSEYFERARTEFIRTLGVARAAISDNGWMFVVSKMSLDYRQPARLDDALSVTLVARHVGAATIDFDQAVRRDQTLLVEGRVQIACVDRDHPRCQHPGTDGDADFGTGVGCLMVFDYSARHADAPYR